MGKHKLYSGLAKYYDLIYHYKDYGKEARIIKGMIARYKLSGGKDLLDAACGTGKHLKHLNKWFSCSGLDISGEMLRIAKKRNKGIRFHRGSMIDFSLGRKFDVITCFFSAIGSVRTYENLERTITAFYDHLKPGGVILIEPWLDREMIDPKKQTMLQTYDSDETKVARMSSTEMKGSLSFLEMNYLIWEKGGPVIHVKDSMTLGLFDRNKTVGIMNKTGFRSKYLKRGLETGRGMLVGVRPLD